MMNGEIVESEKSAGAAKQALAQTKRPGRPAYHSRTYTGLLIFVVIVGLPLIAIPSLRQRLKTRFDMVRAAIRGEQPPPPPAFARVGQNQVPFPREYEQPQPRSAFLAGLVAPREHASIVITDQGGVPTIIPAPLKRTLGSPAPVPSKGKPGTPPAPLASVPAQAETETAGSASSEPVYKKGEREQEAYDIVLSANQTLAGMIKGSDATLRFQGWAAANMGEGSYYVMVTFVQTADNVARKYIWNVKVSSKEVTPLSSYAMSISK
jgi:hypothetical protein